MHGRSCRVHLWCDFDFTGHQKKHKYFGELQVRDGECMVGTYNSKSFSNLLIKLHRHVSGWSVASTSYWSPELVCLYHFDGLPPCQVHRAASEWLNRAHHDDT